MPFLQIAEPSTEPGPSKPQMFLSRLVSHAATSDYATDTTVGFEQPHLLKAASTAVFDRYAASSGGCSVSNFSRVSGTNDSMATPATRAVGLMGCSSSWASSAHARHCRESPAYSARAHMHLAHVQWAVL